LPIGGCVASEAISKSRRETGETPEMRGFLRVPTYHSDPMPWSFLSLLWILLAVGVLLAAVTVRLMAIMLLRPARMTDGRAAWRLKRLGPGDLHLHYSDLSFQVRDEATGQPLKLAAWWIPCPVAAGRSAILLHGYGDAKVGAIAWAPTLHALGFNILALDLRAHGESEGRYCTAGFFERHDVSQVIDELKRQLPAETRQLVLFGVSLGAAVAAATALLRDDLAAVVMECPYPDYELAAASHARVLGAPGATLQRWAFESAQKIAGADFSAVRPVDLIPQIPCPLLVVRSEVDIFIDDVHAAMIEQATRSRAERFGPTVYWNAENAHHVAALYEDPVLYQRKIGEFLEAALHCFHPPYF
jgi:pimeloyl-ACP methyl ester carboxylesterase